MLKIEYYENCLFRFAIFHCRKLVNSTTNYAWYMKRLGFAFVIIYPALHGPEDMTLSKVHICFVLLYFYSKIKMLKKLFTLNKFSKFLFIIAPSSSFPLTVHETPPDVIQVNWENPALEYVDYFELSIKNLSASEDDINGNKI